MGTRNLICVFYRGRFVIAQYSQWDGYPEGQGKGILSFLLNASNIERLKQGLEYIVVLDKEKYNEYYERSFPTVLPGETAADVPPFPPSLSRDTGAKILEIVAEATPENRVPVWLDLKFVNDALFCEWAYCVDLDENVFEVFGAGTSKNKAGSDRFADVGDENAPVPRLVKSFPFTALPATPNEFISTLNDSIRAINAAERESGAADSDALDAIN